ncbi:hypothetical protein ACS0TY_018137 [Phlomoides rotata]
MKTNLQIYTRIPNKKNSRVLCSLIRPILPKVTSSNLARILPVFPRFKSDEKNYHLGPANFHGEERETSIDGEFPRRTKLRARNLTGSRIIRPSISKSRDGDMVSGGRCMLKGK